MRESGILMPVSSLPGPYGIGCFSAEAVKFVDFLAAAGQSIWQILPLSPTGYGDSPYQSCSAFAGNPYFIDLEALCQEGLLDRDQLDEADFGSDPEVVDYGALYNGRYALLRAAYAAWRASCRGRYGCGMYYPDDYYAFTLASEGWLDDYALYMALKAAYEMKPWTQWPKEYRLRDPEALARYAGEHEEEIGFWKFLQYQFDKQWKKLKAYANGKGVQILGDMPIYVSADSVDAWVGGSLFELDGEGNFARVAGCPPDYFAADGQLWGNPLYDWDYHRRTGFAWWIKRVRQETERSFSSLCTSAESLHASSNPAIKLSREVCSLMESGTTTAVPALPGGSSGCATPPPSTTWCGSTTSAALTATGRSRRAAPRPRPAGGKKAPAWSCSAPWRMRWAGCPSSRRIWAT